MAKKQIPDHPGYRMQRVCKATGGVMLLWDTEQGAPMGPGPGGERWCVEHRPDGRAKPTRLHLRTWRIARTALRALAAGRTDEWGFWERDDPERSGRNGEQKQASSRADEQASLRPQRVPGNSLPQHLQESFSSEEIMTRLQEMTEATRPGPDGPVPDWNTRYKAIQLILSYREGLPIQRKEERQIPATTSEQVTNRIATKPGYRRGLRQYIEAIDRQERERLDGLGANREGPEAPSEDAPADE